jgi:hypothetical protein
MLHNQTTLSAVIINTDIYTKYKMGPQLNPGFLGSIQNGFNKFISVFQS